MSKESGDRHAQPHRWRRCAAGLLLFLTGCGQLPPTSAVVIPPVPGGAARIWIYRNDYQYEPRDTPYVWLNGRITGVIQPNAAFYRDVPPAQYTVTVDSYGVAYPISLPSSTSAPDRRPLSKSCRCGRRWVAASPAHRVPSFFRSCSRPMPPVPPSPAHPFTAACNPLRVRRSRSIGRP